MHTHFIVLECFAYILVRLWQGAAAWIHEAPTQLLGFRFFSLCVFEARQCRVHPAFIFVLWCRPHAESRTCSCLLLELELLYNATACLRTASSLAGSFAIQRSSCLQSYSCTPPCLPAPQTVRPDIGCSPFLPSLPWCFGRC